MFKITLKGVKNEDQENQIQLYEKYVKIFGEIKKK